MRYAVLHKSIRHFKMGLALNNPLTIPPKNKNALTPPKILVERLSVLIGTSFPLTRKTRTDGTNMRNLIAATLEKHPLPPPCDRDSYTIIPPKKKGVPRILREYIDTYIATTGDAYNLQVWNRNPVGESIQIEYAFGENLRERDVRFVIVRVDPHTFEVRSIFLLSSDYIVDHFGKFSRPTIKHQLIITDKTRRKILETRPPILYYPDTAKVATMVSQLYERPRASMRDKPRQGRVLALRILREKVAVRLINATIEGATTKNRGQFLELLISQYLGYMPRADEPLMGSYPDLPNQALEVKVQDSPTIDLGMYSPRVEEDVPACPGFTTSDIRYLIALTDEKTGVVTGVVLCPGEKLGEHFSYVSSTNYKCQRAIPMSFFDQYEGRAVHDP